MRIPLKCHQRKTLQSVGHLIALKTYLPMLFLCSLTPGLFFMKNTDLYCSSGGGKSEDLNVRGGSMYTNNFLTSSLLRNSLNASLKINS